MFRRTNEDISDEEVEKILNPHIDIFYNYIYEFLAPEAIAFYLASGYRSNPVWESSFNQHINSILDMLNQVNPGVSNYTKIKDKAIKILKLKYGLTVTGENPLSFNDEYVSDFL